MTGEGWKDGIVNEEAWRSQEMKLLIVCPEPNEEAMGRAGDDRRDMCELLRHPEPGAVRKQFYRFLRQAVRAVHGLPSGAEQGEEQDHEDLMSRIAFIDLKNTGGGSPADPMRTLPKSPGCSRNR